MVFTAGVVRSCDECESIMLDEIWCLFRRKPGHKLDHLLLQIGTFWPPLACCLFPTILKKKSTIKVSALFCELLTACSKVSLPILGWWAAFPSFPFSVMFVEWLRCLVPEWRYLLSVVVFERHSKRTCGKIFRRPLLTDQNFHLFFLFKGFTPYLDLCNSAPANLTLGSEQESPCCNQGKKKKSYQFNVIIFYEGHLRKAAFYCLFGHCFIFHYGRRCLLDWGGQSLALGSYFVNVCSKPYCITGRLFITGTIARRLWGPLKGTQSKKQSFTFSLCT